MGRPFFPYESEDQDLDWLISNFLYERPDFLPIEAGMLPIVLIPHNDYPVRVAADKKEVGAELTPNSDETDLLKMQSINGQK